MRDVTQIVVGACRPLLEKHAAYSTLINSTALGRQRGIHAQQAASVQRDSESLQDR